MVSLLLYGRSHSRAKSPVGPALICFGVLFALTISIGRGNFGLWAASQSRYVTFDVLILVGCYLCLLERWPSKEENATTFENASSFVESRGHLIPENRKRPILASLRLLVILLIVTEVLGGVENGIAEGGISRNNGHLAALVAAHARDAPNTLIESALFPNSSAERAGIRRLAQGARRDRLSFFATSEASRLSRMILPKVRLYALKTSVGRPTSGALLRGKQVAFDASASGEYPIKSVDFEIRGSGGQLYKRLHAAQSLVGWLAIWSSTSVPNGRYTVESIAYDIAGKMSISQAVTITVKN
jgi:hypothetical protein